MNSDDYLRFAQMAVETTAMVSGPILILGLVSGLSVSIFQAATQINDAALAFIPKIAAAFIGILIFGHFMLNKMANFTIYVYTQIALLSP